MLGQEAEEGQVNSRCTVLSCRTSKVRHTCRTSRNITSSRARGHNSSSSSSRCLRALLPRRGRMGRERSGTRVLGALEGADGNGECVCERVSQIRLGSVCEGKEEARVEHR